MLVDSTFAACLLYGTKDESNIHLFQNYLRVKVAWRWSGRIMKLLACRCPTDKIPLTKEQAIFVERALEWMARWS